MIEYIAAHQEKFARLFLEHARITAYALALCAAIGVPIGALCSRSRRADAIATSLCGAARVVPSIAVMLLMMPLLGTGMPTALAALTIVGLPPIVIDTSIGLRSTNASIIEAAEACGMREIDIFFRVRAPLALPMIVTGLRVSGLSVCAGAVLAAYIGAGGLGELVISGLSQFRYDMMIAGAAASAIMSIAIDIAFHALYRAVSEHRKHQEVI